MLSRRWSSAGLPVFVAIGALFLFAWLRHVLGLSSLWSLILFVWLSCTPILVAIGARIERG